MEEKIETQLVLRPWAKINLFLRILGRRSDGYHEIRTLIHPIALFDELIFNQIEDGLVVNCKQDIHGGNLKFPPHDASLSPPSSPKKLNTLNGKKSFFPLRIPFFLKHRIGNPMLQVNLPDNLVTKAAQLFFNKIGESPRVEIGLLKRIPMGGGLGGGSSDAASTLLGLNQLYGYPLNEDAIYKICLELGMDVPFFLEQRAALCSGRGEVIERRYDNIKFWCVLVNPGKILSTKEVYKSLNLALTGLKTEDNISHFSNDLESSAIRLCPEIGDIKELLKKAGAVNNFVCGSGSTVCGLVDDRREAEEVMGRIRQEGSGDWWIEVVSSL